MKHVFIKLPLTSKKARLLQDQFLPGSYSQIFWGRKAVSQCILSWGWAGLQCGASYLFFLWECFFPAALGRKGCLSMLASGQLLGCASGPPRRGASPATVTLRGVSVTARTLPWQPRPHAGSLHIPTQSCLVKIVLKIKLEKGIANYLGPRNRSQEILESNENILPHMKRKWGNLQLSLVACSFSDCLLDHLLCSVFCW